MFTGLISNYASIYSTDSKKDTLRLGLLVPSDFTTDLKLGASIAIDGVCLSVVDIQKQKQFSILFFDVIQETLNRTYLKQKKIGDQVNLERSLRMGDELGGHILSGHISDTATIKKLISFDTTKTFILTMSKKWQSYLMPKTYIALDGISLTIGDVFKQPVADLDTVDFSIHLIPDTLKKTTLQFKKESDRINVEFNVLVKTIVETTKQYLSNHQQ